MKDKEIIEEIDEIITQCCKNVPNKECVDYPDCVRCWAVQIYNAGYRKLPKDSVVLSREEYEKLKKYEYKVQCGVCFTQKEWFDFINEDSIRRTSLLIESKKQGYEQAHKEMLKDCIESNKVAEQIGYEKGSKETAEKFLQFVYDRVIDKHLIRKFEEFAKQFGVEIKE